MKKAKMIPIILILMLVLLLAIAGIVFVRLQKEKQAKEYAETIDEDMEIEIEEHIIPVQGVNEFFSVEKILSNYYLYLKVGNTDAVYSVLTENYKNANKVTTSNAIDVAKKISGTGESFRAREIYYKDDLKNPIYLVYGMIETKQKGQEVYAAVYIDKEMGTSAVEPIQKAKYENYKSEKTDITQIERIEKNNYNKDVKTTLSEDEINQKYFDTVLKEMLFYPEYAYSRLDTEYKTAKFPTLTVYQNYVNGKREELSNMLPELMKQLEDFETEEEYIAYLNRYEVKGLDQYKVEEKADYTQYTFIDDYGNYYIIRAIAPMNYTILLDTYTVDLPEFIEKYNAADAEGRMQLNLVKLFTAINEGDYGYAYQRLNESFRKTNFPTQADFEKYVKENFFAENTVGVSDFKTYDYVYRYEVTLKNVEQPNAAYAVKKTFSMSFGEGTNFEYSFNK